jgi:hypothetical protein
MPTTSGFRPLTPEEADTILAAEPAGILVVGQALAFWATSFSIPLSGELAEGVTADIDFLGSREDARRLAAKLHGTALIPSADDATPNSGKVIVRDFGATGRSLEIDYLSMLAGLDEKAVVRRAIPVQTATSRLRVLHPFDCLASRVCNLHLLPAKRNAHGLAQARLALQVMTSFFLAQLRAGQEKALYKVIEHLAALASSRSGRFVQRHHDLDLMACVPIEHFTGQAFRMKRWPQLLARGKKSGR